MSSCRPPLRVLLLSLVLLAGLPPWLPVFFFCVVLLRIRGFCNLEFENSAQQQPVWSHVFVVFLYFEFISRLDALHSVLNSLYLHTLPMSKLHQQNRFFYRGVMTPNTLDCKARPSFDRCGTSLSVIVILHRKLRAERLHRRPCRRLALASSPC